jgi:hypothetical protein
MNKVQGKLNEQLVKIQYEKVKPINNMQVDMIFDTLEKIDTDLKPLIVTLSSLIKNLEDEKVKTLYVLQFLKFYGIGNDDILTIRPKYIIEAGKLVKIPFLKKKQKESINILLEAMGIKDTLNE